MNQDHGTPRRNWRNRQVPREPDRRRNRSLWNLLLWMSLAIAPWAYYLQQQNECLELNYSMARLRQERERVGELERRLRAERAALQSLVRIEPWALERRGLVRPAPEHVVVVAAPRQARDEWMAAAAGGTGSASR